MSRISTYGSRLCTAGMIGFLAIVAGVGSVHAQNLNDVVRGLNNVVNPNDARRLEDQAYQSGRSDEQRYWHDYGAGLSSSNRYRRDYAPDPGIKSAMAGGIPTMTEPTAAPGQTIPMTDITVSSL
jgi:hypothetical protein